MNKLVDYQRTGPGIGKRSTGGFSFSDFWRIYREKFFKLLAINLMYIVCLIIVGLMCWLPISKTVMKESYLSNKLTAYELNDSYLNIINNYTKSYKITEEQADAALPYITRALDAVKEANPDVLKDGTSGFELDKFSTAQLETVFANFKKAAGALGFTLSEEKPDDGADKLYVLKDNANQSITKFTVADGKLTMLDYIPQTITDLLVLLLCLTPIILLGPINLAATRLTRDYARGVPSFMFPDIWDTIKKNWWQGLVISALQYVTLSCAAIAAVWYYTFLSKGFFYIFGFALCLFLGYVFISMNFYTGIMQVTLDMKLGKILKNAFYFTVIAMGRNILMILAGLLILVIFFALIIYGLAISLVMSLTITAILILPFSFWFYFVSFMTYPKLQKYIIDPYYADLKKKEAEAAESSQLEGGSDDDAEDEKEPEYVYYNGRMVHRSALEQESLFNDDNSVESDGEKK